MEQSNTSKLFDELKQVMLAGDEQKTKGFILAHLKEFPEKFQQEVAASLLNEALERNIQQNAEEYDKKTEGLTDLLKGMQEELEKGGPEPDSTQGVQKESHKIPPVADSIPQ